MRSATVGRMVDASHEEEPVIALDEDAGDVGREAGDGPEDETTDRLGEIAGGAEIADAGPSS